MSAMSAYKTFWVAVAHHFFENVNGPFKTPPSLGGRGRCILWARCWSICWAQLNWLELPRHGHGLHNPNNQQLLSFELILYICNIYSMYRFRSLKCWNDWSKYNPKSPKTKNTKQDPHLLSSFPALKEEKTSESTKNCHAWQVQWRLSQRVARWQRWAGGPFQMQLNVFHQKSFPCFMRKFFSDQSFECEHFVFFLADNHCCSHKKMIQWSPHLPGAFRARTEGSYSFGRWPLPSPNEGKRSTHITYSGHQRTGKIGTVVKKKVMINISKLCTTIHMTYDIWYMIYDEYIYIYIYIWYDIWHDFIWYDISWYINIYIYISHIELSSEDSEASVTQKHSKLRPHCRLWMLWPRHIISFIMNSNDDYDYNTLYILSLTDLTTHCSDFIRLNARTDGSNSHPLPLRLRHKDIVQGSNEGFFVLILATSRSISIKFLW